MSEKEQSLIIKIQTPLSNTATFVKCNDPSYSIDRVMQEAITTLKNAGKPLDSKNLEELYKSHQLFANGVVFQKGDILEELIQRNPQILEKQTYNNKEITIIPINLVASHSGGTKLPERCNGELYHGSKGTKKRIILPNGFPKFIKRPFSGEEMVFDLSESLYDVSNLEEYQKSTEKKFALYEFKFDGYEFKQLLN